MLLLLLLLLVLLVPVGPTWHADETRARCSSASTAGMGLADGRSERAGGGQRRRRLAAEQAPSAPARCSQWAAANLNPWSSHLAHILQRPASAGHGPQGHTLGRALFGCAAGHLGFIPNGLAPCPLIDGDDQGSNQDGWVAHTEGLERGARGAVRPCAKEEHKPAVLKFRGARPARCLIFMHDWSGATDPGYPALSRRRSGACHGLFGAS